MIVSLIIFVFVINDRLVAGSFLGLKLKHEDDNNFDKLWIMQDQG